MKLNLEKNWTTDNNGFPLIDDEVNRYVSVVPSENQIRLSQKPFYLFMHFGMNTSTGREWGTSQETVNDFNIKSIDASQWVKTAVSSGASGIILTCKHHDGFCLWNTQYTDFSVKNTEFQQDIVKLVSDECRRQGISFGVYLSPWDMHEKTYATPAYNDFFCNQLTELLSNYGEIFEVWFDGAKGAEAKSFTYDWQRYYELIRKLQPKANISICGPDIRWVGNEAGKTRSSEFSVVPFELTRAETIEKNSQHSQADATLLQSINSSNEDLGSRAVLAGCKNLHWYPAEVDVSICDGWFWNNKTNKTVKSAKKLFNIYLNSVGSNCSLLLNVPPNAKGTISHKMVRTLKKLKQKIDNITKAPVFVHNPGALTFDNPYLEYNFDDVKKLKYCVLSEDIRFSQRIEKFDLYIKKPNGKYTNACKGTVIGSKKIIPINKKAIGAILIVRQSRCNPILKEIGFYE